MSPNALDYRAIQNTISRYCLALDSKDFSLLNNVFTEDVEAIYPIRQATGVEHIKAAIQKRLSPVSSQHALTTQTIEIAADGKSAKATTYFTGVHFGKGKWEGKEVTAWGTYVDDLVLFSDKQSIPGASGQWLISRRECLWTKRMGEEGVMEGDSIFSAGLIGLSKPIANIGRFSNTRSHLYLMSTMNNHHGLVGYCPPAHDRNDYITLPARPEPLTINPSQTAVIVVDMQNAYASAGGYVDLAGFDISGAQSTIAATKAVLSAARKAGVLIVYFQNGWDALYNEAGTPQSPNYWKSNALKTMRARPELQGKLLAKGSWDYDIVGSLQPQEGDIVIPKTRYSGFFNTSTDSILRSRGVRNLVFTGVATNVCVESSLRDAFHLEYFGIVLEDAVNQIGPDFCQEAALFNIEKFFGWVTSSKEFINAIGRECNGD